MHMSEGCPGIGNGIETMMNGANGLAAAFIWFLDAPSLAFFHLCLASQVVIPLSQWGPGGSISLAQRRCFEWMAPTNQKLHSFKSLSSWWFQPI